MNLCKDGVNINLGFVTYKIDSMISTKNKISSVHGSVKFVQAACNACCMGETAWYLPTRIKEHLKTDSKLHIYQHLLSNEI